MEKKDGGYRNRGSFLARKPRKAAEAQEPLADTAGRSCRFGHPWKGERKSRVDRRGQVCSRRPELEEPKENAGRICRIHQAS